MSDRTWNQIDAKLYEEDWSRGARIVAGVLLARCPNQYGVFKFQLGYLKDFFHSMFSSMELEAFFQEWEADGWVKFYDGRDIIWIVTKWKRFGKPSDNHWKGLDSHLEEFPEVRKDFLTLYQPPSRGIQSPCQPPVNPDSESESESDTEKKIRTPKAPREYPEVYHKLVSDYFDGTLSEREIEAQLEALDGLIRLDKFDQDRIIAILKAVKDGDLDDDNFQWSAQVKSFVPLRAFKNGRHANKMHNLLTAYERNFSRENTEDELTAAIRTARGGS